MQFLEINFQQFFICPVAHDCSEFDYIVVSFSGVLKQVLDKCVVGASVREICELGDKLLTEETGKVRIILSNFYCC